MTATEPAGGWCEVVRAHLAIAVRIYSPDQLTLVATASGLALDLDGGNSATCYEDVARYIEAVGQVLGRTALISAKLTAMNKARILGLRPPGLRWFG